MTPLEVFHSMYPDMKAVLARKMEIKRNGATCKEKYEHAIEEADLYQTVIVILNRVKEETPWDFTETLQEAMEAAQQGLDDWSGYVAELRKHMVEKHGL